jgi:hypothetical protein
MARTILERVHEIQRKAVGRESLAVFVVFFLGQRRPCRDIQSERTLFPFELELLHFAVSLADDVARIESVFAFGVDLLVQLANIQPSVRIASAASVAAERV